MTFNLDAQKRITGKKSDLTALRAKGMIPAVLYGRNMDTLTIAVSKGEFQQCYKRSFKEMSFYEINLEGKKFHTILKDKLVHPVSRNILHIDFMVIQDTATMDFDIPVNFVGEAIGTKEGGFLDVIQRTVKIKCRAKDVPQEIQLDVSNLHVGESLHVRDLPQGKWHFEDHTDVTLVVVHPKKHEEAKPEAPAPEVAEEKPQA
ncbi:MAG TPA: 50S ribosomal protein L25 [Candidatus Syntrophosphaera sp.]|nr:50S ribosomal protein L25 [Candidatus Syntrophosphaera sp.]